MKKNLAFAGIVFAAFIYGNCVCFKISIDYYQGHIYTQGNQPIPGLKIIPKYRGKEDPIGITNENGYFIFEMSDNFISNTLYVEFDGKIIDSLGIVRPGPEGQVSYAFISFSGYEDTLFIDLNGEKRSFERCSSRR